MFSLRIPVEYASLNAAVSLSAALSSPSTQFFLAPHFRSLHLCMQPYLFAVNCLMTFDSVAYRRRLVSNRPNGRTGFAGGDCQRRTSPAGGATVCLFTSLLYGTNSKMRFSLAHHRKLSFFFCVLIMNP